MKTPASHSTVIRFGVFELDLRSEELLKQGMKIRLQGKPVEILAVLLERPGEVITREDLQKKLWPADTFVDFEQGLNNAMKRLRAALDDNAESPHFIETLPRRGYRFVGTASAQPGDQAEVAAGKIASAAFDERVVELTSEGSVVARARHRRSTLSRKLLIAGSVIASLVLIFALVRLLDSRQVTKLTDKDTVVLADFANSTGDAVFDDTLKTGLNIALRESPFLKVLSDSDVVKTLKLMMRPGNSKLTPELARELCQRTGSKAYVAGSIGRLGNEYVLELNTVTCENGDTIAQEQVTARSKEEVLDALGGAASRLRGELGESLASVQKFDVPLAEATTASLEALKAYSLGERAVRDSSPLDAEPYHQRSVQLDPSFAMGYLALGDDYFSLSQVERASKYYAKAFQLRDHASERERLEITADYYAGVTGELDKAAQTYKEETKTYPRDFKVHLDLGSVYGQQGQYEMAADEYWESLRLDPDNVPTIGNLAYDLLARQRFDEARQLVQQAQYRKLDDFLVHEAIYALAGCGKTRFEADAVPRNALVSTARPDKKEACAEKTSNSWTCSATSAPSSEFRTITPCALFVS